MRVVCTGGGTGGHVYPGLAVIEVLREHGIQDIHWMGSKKGPEAGIVSGWQVPFHAIPAGKLRRSLSPRNLLDVFKVFAGILASLRILRRLRPDVVFSKGGYVSVPPCLAARLLRIPVVTHDSDLDPGLATRINAKVASRIMVPYEESRAFFSPALQPQLEVSGNPVRRDIFAGQDALGREIAGCDKGRPLILVLGGSQGAREINELVAASLDGLLSMAAVVHQSGPGHEVPPARPGYRAFAYLNQEYAHLLAAADLVISRAGAGALWEAAAAGKPMILIPLRGIGTRGDQERNAALFAKRGLAQVLPPDGLHPQALLQAVESILGDSGLPDLVRQAANELGAPQAADRIAQAIITCAQKKESHP